MEQVISVSETEDGHLFADEESVILQEHPAFKSPDTQAGKRE